MASPDDGRESDGNEEPRKTFLERKKAVFQKTKEADEELQKIRNEEMEVQGRLQQQSETEHLRRTLESFKNENARLKRELDAKQKKSLDCTTAQASASVSKIERLESQLSFMKERIKVCEREHGGAGDVNVIKKELETLRLQYADQSSELRKLKESMQCITNYSKIQEKEKEQACREVASLKDKIAALRQITHETRQRLLNETHRFVTATKQQQQRPGKSLII